MIQKDNNGNRKIKENKYKILRMSLLLGQDNQDREETINDFEDAAREIDAMNNETYLEELDGKFYETETLEEEQKKLTELVDYVEGRLSQRDSLLSDFNNITGRNLIGLGEIKYETKLFDYQERLKYITEYLDNSRKIEEEQEELSSLKLKLTEEEKRKEENEQKNSELETMLFKKFKESVSNKIDIENINEENIDEKLELIKSTTEESKKSLDIFTKSFETLRNAGISYEDELEYKSYVSGARDNYYAVKEEEYLLTLYKLLLLPETEYSKIFMKRENINNLIEERLDLRSELGIKEIDTLNSVYNIIANQTKFVNEQKENIDNISNITSKIKYIEERIEELTIANQKVEILSLLKEYNIIDTYEEELEIPEISNEEEPQIEVPLLDNSSNIDIEIPKFEFEISEETQEEIVPIETKEEEIEVEEESPKEEATETPDLELELNKPYKNNFVMGTHEPYGLNVDECVDKAISVMKRVGKMLKITVEEEQKEEIPVTPTITEEVAHVEEPQIEPTEIKEETSNVVPTQEEVIPEVKPVFPVSTVENTQPEIKEEDTNKKEEAIVNPFLAPTPEEIEKPQEELLVNENTKVESPFFKEEEPEEEEKTNFEESNVKNVLPASDDFWNAEIKNTDFESDDSDSEMPISNDDFFANSMNDFEFPNLDEFK